MGTIQLPPNGGNGSGGNGEPPKCGLRGKKSHVSREEAERFEAANRHLFGKQYAYQCPVCPFFHLTSKPPEAYAIGDSNLKRLESSAPSETVTTKPVRRGNGETEANVRKLWMQGKSDPEIASELGISFPNVYYHRKKFGTANSNGMKRGRRSTSVLSLSELAVRKQTLEEEFKANMQRLEHEEQRLAQANKLVVSECQEGRGVFIKYGFHEQMMVPKEKVGELTECLMQWV